MIHARFPTGAGPKPWIGGTGTGGRGHRQPRVGDQRGPNGFQGCLGVLRHQEAAGLLGGRLRRVGGRRSGPWCLGASSWAVAASLLLGHWIPALLSTIAILCWLSLGRRAILAGPRPRRKAFLLIDSDGVRAYWATRRLPSVTSRLRRASQSRAGRADVEEHRRGVEGLPHAFVGNIAFVKAGLGFVYEVNDQSSVQERREDSRHRSAPHLGRLDAVDVPLLVDQLDAVVLGSVGPEPADGWCTDITSAPPGLRTR